ncbi:MAG: collagen-like protein [Bacteroidales bacterium]|nr:collagen-like protein [Bacteroidales bacterium]
MADIIVNKKTYIKIGDNTPIQSGIAEGSMIIDRVLFASDMLFGQFASSRCEVQLYNISNVAGQKIKVYQVENEGESSESTVDLYTGQIESSKLDNAGYYRDIIAYDMFYFLAKKNVSDWFNGLFTGNTTEISVLTAFKSLLAHFNLTYDSTTVNATYFSGTLYKTSVVAFEKVSFKDIVKFLLEPLALIPYITPTGDVAVYSPSMSSDIDLTGKYDVNESVFEEYTIQPMQWIGIANIDNEILQQKELTNNDSDLRYDLPYNPIRLDLYGESATSLRTAVLDDFSAKADFVEYIPCEVSMIISDMSINIGDKITTSRGDSYVSEIVLSGPLLIEQQIISRGSPIQEEVEEDYDPSFTYLDNKISEAAADLQNQLDNYEPSAEYTAKVEEFSNTFINGAGLKTIKRTDISTGSTLVYYYAPDSNGNITNSKFVFVMKSTGFAWTNEWKGTADAASEGSTTWSSGIGADGSSLIKILNAYKISADIVTTGTLQSSDGDVSIDLDNKEIDFGSDLHYDPTNGLQIDSTVLIGAAGDAVADAISDLVYSYSYKATSTNSAPASTSSGWTTIANSGFSDTNKYLWRLQIILGPDYSPISTEVSLWSVWGEKGDPGQDGQDGRDGQDGSPGTNGSDGRSVASIVHQYNLSSSNSTAPSESDSGWSNTPATYVSGKYYWERDEITWTNPSSTSHTTAVLSRGLNKAILDANEANSAIGSWCYSNNTTYINGAKIYTGSITSDKISVGTAQIDEAFINALMANSVEVDGDITINSPNLSLSFTDQEKNAVAQEKFSKNYSQLEFGEQLSVLLILYARKVVYAAENQSKFTIQDAGEDEFVTIYPNAVLVANTDDEYSGYGINAEIGGNAIIHGDLTVNGNSNIGGGGGPSDKGSIEVQNPNGSSRTGSETFNTNFTSAPLVFLQLRADGTYPSSEATVLADTSVVPYSVSTTGFSYKTKNEPTYSGSFYIDWVAFG